MRTTEMPPCRCPSCGHALDLATCYTARSVPKPGSISICIACQAVNLFDEDLTVRPPTEAELARLKASTVWSEIERHRRAAALAWAGASKKRGQS